ncbi:sorting nexin-33 isoform X4 [Strongylocentrotus purpuratus]|uniref:PX domain-containing protein n=1 Tax=Strongylocentrotus purpuratus TaxID=7668 RepID=A0A7M7T2C8_STRPU|nr:sorting nexin-33 isoform X3 [Strongylocentrotus purpuratus]XP_030848721.1 sorting nexin-33 isoform X4 [Strongylocentrotus purpuratus]
MLYLIPPHSVLQQGKTLHINLANTGRSLSLSPSPSLTSTTSPTSPSVTRHQSIDTSPSPEIARRRHLSPLQRRFAASLRHSMYLSSLDNGDGDAAEDSTNQPGEGSSRLVAREGRGLRRGPGKGQSRTLDRYQSDSGLNGNNYGLSAPNRQFKQRNSEASARSGTVKKNFASRFSVFAKTGGEAYLLGGGPKKGASPDGTIRIIEAEDGPRWEETVGKYTCEIKNPKKESKLKGIKSFIAYQVTPSNTGIRVSRRYKHFDWLYERLAEKFTLVIVPPLPDKQVTGRYEEAFIEKRMDQLQRWMNRMTAHPVIGPSDVMIHFTSCTDEKLWKQGKRKAEKDEFLGAAFYQNIEPPANNLDVATIERQHDTFTRFTKSFDSSVAVIQQVIHDYSKKHLGPFKREYQKIGNSFTELATTFNLDNRPKSVQLTEALNFTGKTYEEIGELFYQQPKYDLHPFEDFLKEYGGMMSCFPDMIHFHKHTVQTVKECQKQREEQKMDFEEAEAVKKRADVISYAMMAEVNHFHRERVEDFKWIMQVYLKEQIKFYKSLTIKLEEALQKYDELDR